MRVVSLLAVLAALLCGLSACGSSDDSTAGETDTVGASASATPKEEPVQAAEGSWAILKRFAEPNADKLIIPQGLSPGQVVIRDLKVGSGPAIAPGDVFVSEYVSFSYESEKLVEPTPEPGKEATAAWVEGGRLIWGTGERVPGWEPGLKGIRAGGLRELIVPSRLAYENGARVYLVKVSKIEPQ
ncbi:MAG TPA: FKBP-type peptidyl-prolyl cis-trans isomerase [Solirubrobacterales bacterium]|nr:FKBP-type peptidyl-prolyl cis-trans isomerase [Solirubrobacterales bacterium]